MSECASDHGLGFRVWGSGFSVSCEVRMQKQALIEETASQSMRRLNVQVFTTSVAKSKTQFPAQVHLK